MQRNDLEGQAPRRTRLSCLLGGCLLLGVNLSVEVSGQQFGGGRFQPNTQRLQPNTQRLQPNTQRLQPKTQRQAGPASSADRVGANSWRLASAAVQQQPVHNPPIHEQQIHEQQIHGQPLPAQTNRHAMGAGHAFQPMAVHHPHSVVQTAAMNSQPAHSQAAHSQAAHHQQVQGLGAWLQAQPRSLTLAAARESALVHNKKIAVLSHVPREKSSEATEKSALFDPVFGVGLNGGHMDRQNRSIIDSLGALTNEQESYFLRPYEQNQFYLEQRNYLGGLARLGFATDYQSVDPAGIFTFVNPGWDSAVKFRYEQPLGRGAGVIANTAPIVIASELAEQARVQLEALVQKTLAEVEMAYWQLEFSQSTAELHRDFVSESTKILDGEQKRLDNGRGTLPELVRAKERVLRARVAAHRAETNVAVAEQKLRLVMGIQSLDGSSLVAADSSRVGRYYQQLDLALGQSKSRPDVAAQHAAIRAAQADVALQENKLRPDVKLYFDYAVTGLEENFYNSLQTAGGHSFNEWVVGLTYRRPIGLRAEWASVQKSRLAESRQVSRLAELELKASNDVVSAYQRVRRTEQEMPLHRDRVEAAIQEREARRELYKNGRGDLEALIDAEDRYLEATTEQQVAFTAKQAAVTLYRFASGAITCGDGLGRSRVQFGAYGHLQQVHERIPPQRPDLRAGYSNGFANTAPQTPVIPRQPPAPQVPRLYAQFPNQQRTPSPQYMNPQQNANVVAPYGQQVTPRPQNNGAANMRYSIPTNQGSGTGLPRHSFIDVLPQN